MLSLMRRGSLVISDPQEQSRRPVGVGLLLRNPVEKDRQQM